MYHVMYYLKIVQTTSCIRAGTTYINGGNANHFHSDRTYVLQVNSQVLLMLQKHHKHNEDCTSVLNKTSKGRTVGICANTVIINSCPTSL